MERRFTVRAEDAGKRIDTWLCGKMPNYSRKQVKELLDGGRILINNRRVVIAGWELERDDEVEVRAAMSRRNEGGKSSEESASSTKRGGTQHLEAISKKGKHIGASIDRYLKRRSEAKSTAPERTGARAQKRRRGKGEQEDRPGKRPKLQVYFEDRDLIVVEKPGGILSMPKDAKDGRESMLSRVGAYLRRKYPESKHSFVGPLHRLDMETSGIMVFALSKEGQRLSSQFKRHTIDRAYVAIVSGAVPGENGVIRRNIEKGNLAGGKKGRGLSGEGGRTAVSEYRVKERYAKATLLEVRVRTGRTHQIRIHLAEEGFPILGDALYAEGIGKGDPLVKQHLGFGRHALHAVQLRFRHPTTKKRHSFRSPLPRDMQSLIDDLREGASHERN